MPIGCFPQVSNPKSIIIICCLQLPPIAIVHHCPLLYATKPLQMCNYKRRRRRLSPKINAFEADSEKLNEVLN